MNATHVATVELDGIDVECWRAGTLFITRVSDKTLGHEDVAMLAFASDNSITSRAFRACMGAEA